MVVYLSYFNEHNLNNNFKFKVLFINQSLMKKLGYKFNNG